MLKLIVNNTEVDLGELKGLTLQYNSGIFEFNKIEGSYTIPFSLPMSDLNRKIFEYPERHESVDNTIREYDAELWHSGIKLFDASITSDVYKNNISCNLYIDSGDFYKKLKAKPLNEQDIGGDKTFTLQTEYDYTSDDFLLYQVFNNNFLDGTHWLGFGSVYTEVDEVGTDSQYVSDYENITGWDQDLYPTLYFRVEAISIYKVLFAYPSDADRTAGTNTLFYTQIITHEIIEMNSSGFGGILTITGTLTTGNKFKVTADPNKIYQNYVNIISEDPFTYEFFFDQYEPTVITPFPLLYKVLQYLFNGLGFNYTDTFFTGNYRRLNIFNVNNAVQKDIYLDENEVEAVRNKIDTYNLANHVPNMPTEEFVLAVQNFFNIFFLLDENNNIKIIDRQYMLQIYTYDDLQDKVMGSIEKTVFDYKTGYNLSVEGDGNDAAQSWIENYGEHESVDYLPITDWLDDETRKPGDIRHAVNKVWYKFFIINSYDTTYEVIRFQEIIKPLPNITGYLLAFRNFQYLQSFSHAEKGVEINLGVSTLSDYDEEVAEYNDNGYISGTAIYNEPIVKMKGNLYFKDTIEDFAFRLMSYVEVGETKPGGGTATTPFGTQAYGGVEISPYWSYINRWEDFLVWYDEARKVEYTCELNLSASDIKHFDFSRKKLIDRNKFFIKSFKVQLLRNSIAPAKAVMIKF